LVYSSQ